MSHALESATRSALDREALRTQAVGGGSISKAWRMETSDGPVFVKETAAANGDWFAAEADGLCALARCEALRVPAVLGSETVEGRAFLFLEWIEMGQADAGADERCGRALAALHAIRSPRHGWQRDNYIGATAQPNGWHDDGARFMQARRIAFQLDLARQNGYGAQLDGPGKELLACIPDIMRGAPTEASLLHGDLWAGNRGTAGDGAPVLFDPAVYYGDPQADLAMSELFGGFGPAFYAAYAEASGETGDTAARRDLHRLYHVLNHLNLFGGGYLANALALMRRLGG